MAYKRPHFVREESWRYKRVRESWRAPRGKTSRVRRSKEGWPPVVKIGYSRPKAQRGRHPSGLAEIMVWRPKDLENVDPKTQAVRIAHTVGERKRVEILDQASKATIIVLNPGPKKAPEVAPEVVAEPTEPTTPAEPETEATTETTQSPTEEAEAATVNVPASLETREASEPKEETKKTEATKEPPKKQKSSKKSKKKRSEK